eukprot:scaffold319988_cov35-Tisochrysis_lutea.AAC.1
MVGLCAPRLPLAPSPSLPLPSLCGLAWLWWQNISRAWRVQVCIVWRDRIPPPPCGWCMRMCNVL